MSAASRRKGARGQAEAAAAFAAATGIPARNGGQTGMVAGMDIDAPTLEARVEIKRVEQLAVTAWLAQAERDAGEMPYAVLWRGSRMPWRCIVAISQLGDFAEAVVAARRANGIGPPGETETS